MDEPTEEVDLDTKLSQLASMMEGIQAQVTAFSLQETEIKHAIDEERKLYEERVAKLKGDLMKIHELRFDVNKELRKVQADLESVKRQKEQEERARIQREQFESLTAKWDKMLMGAPWREFAKEHQLYAAKYMANRAKVILADTMGLGKTCSVLIALDFIKVMTAEASNDFPVVMDV